MSEYRDAEFSVNKFVIRDDVAVEVRYPTSGPSNNQAGIFVGVNGYLDIHDANGDFVIRREAPCVSRTMTPINFQAGSYYLTSNPGGCEFYCVTRLSTQAKTEVAESHLTDGAALPPSTGLLYVIDGAAFINGVRHDAPSFVRITNEIQVVSIGSSWLGVFN